MIEHMIDSIVNSSQEMQDIRHRFILKNFKSKAVLVKVLVSYGLWRYYSHRANQ